MTPGTLSKGRLAIVGELVDPNTTASPGRADTVSDERPAGRGPRHCICSRADPRTAGSLAQWSGRPGALLCPAPLRTRTCPFPSIRLKQAPQARRRAEVPGRCRRGSGRVRDGVRCSSEGSVLPGDDLRDRLAGGRQPHLPLAWGLWPVIVGQERLPADRASTVLGFEEPSAGLVDRQGRLAPPFGPVLGQGGVVRGRRCP